MATHQTADLVQTNVRLLKVVRLYACIAWLYLAIFTPLFVFVLENVWLSVVMVIDAAVLIWVGWALRAKTTAPRITFALSCIAALTVGSLLVTGGVAQTGPLLSFPYIPFIVFLRQRASAQRWLFGMLLFAVALLVLSMAGAITLPYGQTVFAVGILMYIFTLLLTLAYVREKNISDDHLSTNTQELVRTNRKLSEAVQAQKRATARAETILKSIGEGVIVFDADGRVNAVNRVAEKLLGFDERRLIEGDYTELVMVVDENGLPLTSDKRPLRQVITTKKPVSADLYYGRKGGVLLPVHISIAPIIMEGRLEGAIEVFRDITIEKEIDKSKTEFVSLASHQLRTPLSTISWYTEMLMAGDAGKVTKEQSRYLDEIYQSNRRMTELVGSLLNVSRIELGTFSVEPEPTDLIKLAQDIVKSLEPQIFARKIDFREDYNTNEPVITVDPKLMRMVIENLASNAVKYTPEAGKVTLHIKHRGSNTHIIVEDTGLGIPERQQSKIFSKLFRADNVKTHDTEGTGLGLYLVKSIVDYSGGKIRFESRENRGTAFFVTIPDNGMKHKRGSKGLN